MQPPQGVAQVHGDARAQGLAGAVQGGGIGGPRKHRQIALRRQGQQQGLERRLRRLIVDGAAERLGEALLADLVGPAIGAGQDQVAGEALAGFPAVEQVRVARQQGVGVARRGVGGQGDGGGKTAQRRQDRPLADVLQPQRPRRGVEHHQIGVAQHAAVLVEQAEADRDRHGALVRLAVGRGRDLAQGQVEGLGLGVIGRLDIDGRRTGLLVPGEEVGQVAAADFGEAGDEGLDGGGVAVPAIEIEIHAASEIGLADQQPQHADHLRALFVDGRGVEVVDLLIGAGTHGMSQGAGILGELPGTQGAHLLDPLHRVAAHVGREGLVAEHRQALLQAQLEPVAAGDPVAGPVVEIFVRHHPLDTLVVEVGGGLRIGQQQRRVEDVQPLVLHRPGVEVAHGDDHEQVEVVLPAPGALVPRHRPLQAVHGVGGAGRHARIDEDA